MPSEIQARTETSSCSRPPTGGKIAALFAFAIVYAVLLAWIPRITERLDPLTGDEPFYVMTAFSLLDDHDLNELNNYSDRDYDRFYPAFGPTERGWSSYPDPLPPHSTHTDLAGIYSKHGLGMSLIVAVPWRVGGRELTLVLLAAIAALVAANMTLLAHRFGGGPWLSAGVAILLALTNPLVSHSLLIFPEMSAALCIVYVVRRLVEPANAKWRWFLIGSAIGFLPWLHYRLALIAAVLAVFALFQLPRSRGWASAFWFLVAPVVAASSLTTWYVHLYGSPRPPGSDHAGFSNFSGAINGLAGTLFDQQWGALSHNPVLAIAIVALVSFVMHHPRQRRLFAAVAIPYFALIGTYLVWWGEWNPPARYLADIVPLAAAPLGWWLSTCSRRLGAIVISAAALPALAVSATFLHDPQLMYNQPDGTSRLLETWSDWTGLDLADLVPSYVFFSESSRMDRILFAAAIVILLYVGSELALRRAGRSG